MLKTLVFLLVLGTSLPSAQSWGWGKVGHISIELTAASLNPNTPLSHLMKNNLESMEYLAMVPDFTWKHGPTPHPLEGQSHFFDVDFYSPGGQPIPQDITVLINKYGEDKVLKEGTSPWRMRQMANLLVKVMKKPHPSPLEILVVATTMGHYVGDLSQPLHNTSDYDGEAAGVKGIHAYFESLTLEQMNQAQMMAELRQASEEILKSVPDKIPPIEAALKLSMTAHAKAKPLLATGKKFGLTPQFQHKVRPMIIHSLATSSAVLAKIWYAAWILAGKPDFATGSVGRVPVPDWIPLDYMH